MATIETSSDRDRREIEIILEANLLRKIVSAIMHLIDIIEISDIDSNRRSDRGMEVGLFELVSRVGACVSGSSEPFLRGLTFEATGMRLNWDIALAMQSCSSCLML